MAMEERKKNDLKRYLLCFTSVSTCVAICFFFHYSRLVAVEEKERKSLDDEKKRKNIHLHVYHCVFSLSCSFHRYAAYPWENRFRPWLMETRALHRSLAEGVSAASSLFMVTNPSERIPSTAKEDKLSTVPFEHYLTWSISVRVVDRSGDIACFHRHSFLLVTFSRVRVRSSPLRSNSSWNRRDIHSRSCRRIDN